MSLYDELKAAATRDKLRLHTPGHKGVICDSDLTELTDGSFPSTFVDNAESCVAKLYGAAHARFLCGGSSQGVKAAVFYAHTDAVVDIDSHRSVFDGFKLSGKNCITAGERGSVYPITLDQIKKALTRDTGAVVVTTPTYYGYCADVRGIADFCKSRGLLFIADGAHGAHFGFSERLPENAASIADVCNVSTHKTLSALTQTAVLLDNLDKSEHAALSEAVDIMGTTSPSYLLYSSIDYAVSCAAESGAAYERLYGPISELRMRFPFLDNDDFTRLVLDCTALDVDVGKLNTALISRGVYSEMTDGKHIVFIFTAENTPNDVNAFSAALTECISEL